MSKSLRPSSTKAEKRLAFVGRRLKIGFNRRAAGDVFFEELPPFKIQERF